MAPSSSISQREFRIFARRIGAGRAITLRGASLRMGTAISPAASSMKITMACRSQFAVPAECWNLHDNFQWPGTARLQRNSHIHVVFYLGPGGTNSTAVFRKPIRSDQRRNVAQQSKPFTLSRFKATTRSPRAAWQDRSARYYRPIRREWLRRAHIRCIDINTGGILTSGEAVTGSYNNTGCEWARHDCAQSFFGQPQLCRLHVSPTQVFILGIDPGRSGLALYSDNSRPRRILLECRGPYAACALRSSRSTRSTSSGTSTLTESCAVSATRIYSRSPSSQLLELFDTLEVSNGSVGKSRSAERRTRTGRDASYVARELGIAIPDPGSAPGKIERIPSKSRTTLTMWVHDIRRLRDRYHERRDQNAFLRFDRFYQSIDCLRLDERFISLHVYEISFSALDIVAATSATRSVPERCSDESGPPPAKCSSRLHDAPSSVAIMTRLLSLRAAFAPTLARSSACRQETRAACPANGWQRNARELRRSHEDPSPFADR